MYFFFTTYNNLRFIHVAYQSSFLFVVFIPKIKMALLLGLYKFIIIVFLINCPFHHYEISLFISSDTLYLEAYFF